MRMDACLLSYDDAQWRAVRMVVRNERRRVDYQLNGDTAGDQHRNPRGRRGDARVTLTDYPETRARASDVSRVSTKIGAS